MAKRPKLFAKSQGNVIILRMTQEVATDDVSYWQGQVQKLSEERAKLLMTLPPGTEGKLKESSAELVQFLKANKVLSPEQTVRELNILDMQLEEAKNMLELAKQLAAVEKSKQEDMRKNAEAEKLKAKDPKAQKERPPTKLEDYLAAAGKTVVTLAVAGAIIDGAAKLIPVAVAAGAVIVGSDALRTPPAKPPTRTQRMKKAFGTAAVATVVGAVILTGVAVKLASKTVSAVKAAKPAMAVRAKSIFGSVRTMPTRTMGVARGFFGGLMAKVMGVIALGV